MIIRDIPAWFKHDCDQGCIFVGNRKEGTDNRRVDFWVHPLDNGWYDLIRRYSDRDSDYGCWPWKEGQRLPSMYEPVWRYANMAGDIPSAHEQKIDYPNCANVETVVAQLTALLAQREDVAKYDFAVSVDGIKHPNSVNDEGAWICSGITGITVDHDEGVLWINGKGF